MRGLRIRTYTLEGDDPETMHQQAAAVFDTCWRIAEIQKGGGGQKEAIRINWRGPAWRC